MSEEIPGGAHYAALIDEADLTDRLARLEAENRALRSALAPFARASQQVQERRERYLWTDDTPLLIPITVGRSLEVTASVGDLRRAATVLEKRGE
jgi:anti-sigma factor RsiW